MNGREFLDTNILIYAHDARDPSKRACARELIRRLLRERRGVLSLQVLQEFFAAQSGYIVERLAFRNPFQAPS